MQLKEANQKRLRATTTAKEDVNTGQKIFNKQNDYKNWQKRAIKMQQQEQVATKNYKNTKSDY